MANNPTKKRPFFETPPNGDDLSKLIFYQSQALYNYYCRRFDGSGINRQTMMDLGWIDDDDDDVGGMY